MDRPPAGGPLLSLVTLLGSCLLGAAVLLMATQVVLRFGFNAPQAWAEEVDRYLFVWAVYTGAIIGLIRGTHIRVTFVIEKGGETLELASQWLGRIINLVSFSFVAYFGYTLAWSNRFSEFYTLQFMPQVIFYLSVPVCMTVMAFHLLTTLHRPPGVPDPDDQ